MKVQIISGSIRQGRATPLVTNWVERTAKETWGDKIELEVVDLNDYDLPMFDEAASPKYNPNRQLEGDAKAWLDKLAEADGYVFVTPEYNHSVPGAFKNALDYIDYQTDKKAVAIVSHGSMGGVRATEHLRNIASELGLVSTPIAVNIVGMIGAGEIITEDGTLANQESGAQGMLETELEQLAWYTEALKNAR